MKYFCVRCNYSSVKSEGELCSDCAKQKELILSQNKSKKKNKVVTGKRIAQLSEAAQRGIKPEKRSDKQLGE